MAQLEKCLQHKNGEMNSDTQHPVKPGLGEAC